MKIKRGDTFLFFGLLPTDFPAGTWTAACSLFDSNGVLYPISAIISAPVPPSTQFGLTLRAEATATALWPIGPMIGDVQFTDTSQTPAFITSSRTFTFDVLESYTP